MSNELDEALKRICDEHGWSYPGPQPLVERLFTSVAVRDSTVLELRGELRRFHEDLVNALGDHHYLGYDVVESVRRLRERVDSNAATTTTRISRWAELMRKWGSRDKDTRRDGYREGARLAFNAGVELREALLQIWKRYG